MKDGLNPNEKKIRVDNYEKYDNRQKVKCSIYFEHSSFRSFAACCYYNEESGHINKESVTIRSATFNHFRSASLSCVIKVINL